MLKQARIRKIISSISVVAFRKFIAGIRTEKINAELSYTFDDCKMKSCGTSMTNKEYRTQ